MFTRFSTSLFFVLTLVGVMLAGCGGGSSTAESPADITSRGVITGFGSVYVNGVRYHTNSSSFTIDDNPGSESDLRLGMVVTVTGTRNDDNTGNAINIVFDNELQGPVSNLATDPDGLTKSFTVLGINVKVDRVSTSFHDVSFDSLANDDLVEVSGFYDNNQVLIASFIERKSGFSAGISEVELKGTVTSSSSNSFVINSITINYDASGVSTDLSRMQGVISDGLFVEVKGTIDGAGAITATRIALEDDGFDDNMSKVSVEGIITDYVDDSNFMISGTPIDASGAINTPASLVLGNGIKVEAEGPMINGVLQAIKIGARGGDGVVIEATINSIDNSVSSITLDLINGEITVYSDIRTRMEDKTKAVERLSLADLSSGDFVEVRGILDGSDRVVLTELRRDDSDDVILQGSVEDFDSGNSITILGVTVFTSGSTQFEDVNDNSISTGNFYSSVSIGALVKIKDKKSADGIADEVEFED